MDKYIFDRSNGLWYERQGGYCIPCLTLPVEKEQDIGLWGGGGTSSLSRNTAKSVTPASTEISLMKNRYEKRESTVLSCILPYIKTLFRQFIRFRHSNMNKPIRKGTVPHDASSIWYLKPVFTTVERCLSGSFAATLRSGTADSIPARIFAPEISAGPRQEILKSVRIPAHFFLAGKNFWHKSTHVH